METVAEKCTGKSNHSALESQKMCNLAKMKIWIWAQIFPPNFWALCGGFGLLSELNLWWLCMRSKQKVCFCMSYILFKIKVGQSRFSTQYRKTQENVFWLWSSSPLRSFI